MPKRNGGVREKRPLPNWTLTPSGRGQCGITRQRLMPICDSPHSAIVRSQGDVSTSQICGRLWRRAVETRLSKGTSATRVRPFAAFGTISEEHDQWSIVREPKPNWRRNPSAARSAASWSPAGCAARRATRCRSRVECAAQVAHRPLNRRSKPGGVRTIAAYVPITTCLPILRICALPAGRAESLSESQGRFRSSGSCARIERTRLRQSFAPSICPSCPRESSTNQCSASVQS